MIYFRVIADEVERFVRNGPSPWPSADEVVSTVHSAVSQVVGDAPTLTSLDDLQHIRNVLHSRLDTVLGRLGMRVTRVEVEMPKELEA